MGVIWKVNGIYKADPNKVCKEINSIGEKVTPKQIVEMAEDESTELHKCFEWDDSIAAQKYREGQAQHILTLLVIESDDKPEDDKEASIPIRVFSSTGERTNEYMETYRVVKDPELYANLVRDAQRDMLAMCNKYKTVEILKDKITETVNIWSGI